MSKLEELVEQLCPNGVKYRALGELVNYEQPGKYIVSSTKYSDEYQIPVLTAGQTFILGYTNEINGIYEASEDNPVIIFDDFTAAFKWVDFQFKVKSSAIKILTANSDLTIIRYIYHVMGFLNISSDEHKRLWIGMYSNIKVPVPPLEVQQEIVHILDNFTELEKELEKELELRRKQYEYYRDLLLDFRDVHAGGTNAYSVSWLAEMLHELCPDGVEYKALGEFANISRGKVMSKDYLKENIGEYPVYSSQTENNGQLGSISTYMYDGEYLTWTTDGANAGTVFFRSGKFSITNVCGLIDVKNSNIIPKFLYYYLYKEAPNHVKAGMGNPKLMSNVMSNIKLPVPPLAVQQRIVHILDRFDALCNDLTNGLPAEIALRRKQYEYYRDKLLNFKELKEA